MSRILIVEDDPAVLRGLKDNLTFESYDVLTAANGERAYRLIHDERPDLVLMDVMLPGMWGSELCRRVRAQGITTPIVMLTAKAEESDRVLALDLGADDYLSKPFGIRELSARIRSLLRNRRDALEDHRRLGAELRAAADVQRRLFPRCGPLLRTLACAGACRPASAVGGDYFDYVPIDGSRVALVLADIAGKGMPAALLMASLRGVIRALAPSMGTRLEEFVSTINALLQHDAGHGSYATLFYGVYDDETQMLDYVNAGHPPPIVVGGPMADRYLAPSCPPVGMFDQIDANPRRIHLCASDSLVIHSDGAPDALNVAGEEFGQARLIELVKGLWRESAQQLCAAVLDAIAHHQVDAPQHDDITVLVAQVKAVRS